MARKRKRKLTDEVQLKLRFSETLRRDLVREAKRQKRSLNMEIVSRLNQSLLQNTDLTTGAARALLAGLDPAIVAKLVEIALERDIFGFGVKPIEGESK